MVLIVSGDPSENRKPIEHREPHRIALIQPGAPENSAVIVIMRKDTRRKSKIKSQRPKEETELRPKYGQKGHRGKQAEGPKKSSPVP